MHDIDRGTYLTSLASPKATQRRLSFSLMGCPAQRPIGSGSRVWSRVDRCKRGSAWCREGTVCAVGCRDPRNVRNEGKTASNEDRCQKKRPGQGARAKRSGWKRSRWRRLEEVRERQDEACTAGLWRREKRERPQNSKSRDLGRKLWAPATGNPPAAGLEVCKYALDLGLANLCPLQCRPVWLRCHLWVSARPGQARSFIQQLRKLVT